MSSQQATCTRSNPSTVSNLTLVTLVYAKPTLHFISCTFNTQPPMTVNDGSGANRHCPFAAPGLAKVPLRPTQMTL